MSRRLPDAPGQARFLSDAFGYETSRDLAPKIVNSVDDGFSALCERIFEICRGDFKSPGAVVEVTFEDVVNVCLRGTILSQYMPRTEADVHRADSCLGLFLKQQIGRVVRLRNGVAAQLAISYRQAGRRFRFAFGSWVNAPRASDDEAMENLMAWAVSLMNATGEVRLELTREELRQGCEMSGSFTWWRLRSRAGHSLLGKRLTSFSGREYRLPMCGVRFMHNGKDGRGKRYVVEVLDERRS